MLFHEDQTNNMMPKLTSMANSGANFSYEADPNETSAMARL
jgi:hypothetical protein